MGSFIGQGKRLRYRDQTGASQTAHANHWEGFEFDAGRVIVASVGPWGTLQVWAKTEAEGKRVIRHAAAIAGLEVDNPTVGEWVVTTAKEGRNGQEGRYRVATVWDLPAVTKRIGPSGPPLVGE